MRRMTSTPRKHSLRAAALVASAAMVAVAFQTGSATAQPDAATGALALSGQQRVAAIKSAQADAAGTAQKIGLGGQEKLIARDVIKDADGTVHTRYERTYEGLPVLGGDLVVHEKKNGTRTVDKATQAEIAVPTTDAAQPAAAAKKSALSASAAEKNTKAEAKNAPRKVIWAASGKPVLAYETVVTGVQKDGTPSELHVVTDAKTGKKLFQDETIETGTGTSSYSGTVPLTTTKSGSTYNLTDGARGGHKTYDLNQGTSGTGTLFTDADDKWGGGRQTAAVDAHYGAAVTWDYYKNVHGRNGIRNDGKAAYSRVHYGNSYVNAFWQDSCFCMTYGDGQNNSNPLTALDVAAHEMSHGVTAATAKLNYSGESGGLNEATSDIFGTAAEFYANNAVDKGDYLIGEKIDINGDGTPLRYMDKPSKDGASKDYWSSSLGNVDVHYSSGPANHWFYLVSEGSGSKTINGVNYNSPTYDNSKVTGIGRAKAEKIWYRALTTYFTSTTKYAGARTGTLKAAADLYGANSTEYKTVAAAWTGINVK
ncbi:peptidase [Streptomyces rimosus subsp. rimosus]|uniref:Neutral metalloproteinase n=3 Tax=Actinomycetes TaxID=1760 RepID=A0A8A1UNN3_STRR1|nr:peptidase [Streptomyces rimosus]KOG69579.1 peptidase [Kitasatospora aureofaciens]KOT43439.1 peptidase [Streptomyces rimosus subsp. rimosus]KOT44454.1 peptidase [Streptomyces sp. NRRL WC-3701]MYT46861.1 peptidase M4 family protein [Streptomyces sp. SID5471]QGY66479.1 peptidase M4 family protein [Streptomyces rimosus R6-500]QST79575.1 M4 family metallopeptidase [Streptomyces rimosus subsp. rimosus ATCC 10970]